MKRCKFLFLIGICLMLGLHGKAQTIEEDWNSMNVLSSSVPEEIVDIVTHDVSSPEFVYSKTFDLPDSYHSIECNIPFAREFNISGGHISFVIDKVDFDFYIYRKHKQNGYFDLQIGFCAKQGPEIVKQLYKIGIVRIIFN